MTHRRRGPAVSPVPFDPSPSRRRLARAVVAGLAGSAALAGAIGCVHDPMPFDPLAAQAWERREDAQTRAPHLNPLPATQQTQFGSAASRAAATRPSAVLAGPVVKMTLQEVVHRAIANNLDIRVAGFDTAVDQTRVLEAQANFDPQFFSDIGFQDVNHGAPGTDSVTLTPGTNPFTNKTTLANGASVFQTFVARVDKEALTTFDAGFRQNLEAGGKITLQQNVNNSWFFPTRSLLNPYYENELVLALNQPLLQNFGVAVNQARITIAQNTQRVSLLDFRKTVEDTVLKIEQTYWQLLQAERDVATARQLVDASDQVSALLYYRREHGQEVTGAQVNQALADTSARRVSLLAEENRRDDLSDQLKLLMNDPAYPVSGATKISPADDFQRDPLRFNEDDQVETALENRLELGQQQVRIASAEIAVDVARNGLLPQLNLALSGTVDGVSRTLPGTFNAEGQFNHLGYTAELQFQLPIGNRAARAVWQRALLQRLQAIASYGSQVEKVTADVRTAMRLVDFSWQRLTEAHNSVLGYQKTLASLQAQIRSGDQPLTFDFVLNLLQDQERYATQQQAEHQAESDYNSAVAQLESSKGTILRYNNILMEQEPVPFDLQLAGAPQPRPTPPGYPYPDDVRGAFPSR